MTRAVLYSLTWIFTSFLQYSNCFVWIENVTVNGKTYVEKREQPWFRVPHSHTMVEADKKEESAFGKHVVPADEEYKAPKWNEEQMKYFPCRDIMCACPYYNGTVSNSSCILPNGNVLGRAVRKEIRMMSDEERRGFENAVNVMKRSGEYNQISRIHKYSGVHSGPAFVIWHREFLKRIELAIRRHLPPSLSYLGIPYWDSSLDSLIPEQKDTVMFTEELLGESDEDGWVVTGPYKNWTTMEGRKGIRRKVGGDPEGEFLSPARIDWLVDNNDYRAIMAATLPLTTCPTYAALDDRFLEYSHDYLHFFVGGDMARSHSSSNDIVFCIHHSMIDHIWEMWRQKHQDRSTRETMYHVNDERCFPPWHFGNAKMPMLDPHTNIDGLSNHYTDFMYQFESRPTCTMEKRDCGSKFLFCNVSEVDTQCVSKIRIGGNCRGFEQFQSCYNSKCVNGECRISDEKKREIGKKRKKDIDNLYM